MFVSSHDISGTGMAYLAKGVAQASELVKKFNRLAPVVIPGVVKWRYTFENDGRYVLPTASVVGLAKRRDPTRQFYNKLLIYNTVIPARTVCRGRA